MSDTEPRATGADLTDGALADFFATGLRDAVDALDAELWRSLERATQGGKRFRPRLVLAAHDALGGERTLAAVQAGVALELLHTAFVAHDDVIDGDRVRRGRPNVSGEFAANATRQLATPDQAHRYGDAAGILAGDLALAGAIRMIATCGAEPPLVAELLDLVNHGLRASASGELADVRLSHLRGDIPLSAVIDVAERKTAIYSFALPLQAGALLAGATADAVADLGECGRLLGIAFQLEDDLDGVFGDPAITGKSALSDLREGAHTALIAHARTTRWWPQIAGMLGDPALSEADAAVLRELLEASGARRAVDALARGYRSAATELAVQLGISHQLRPFLDATVARGARAVA